MTLNPTSYFLLLLASSAFTFCVHSFDMHGTIHQKRYPDISKNFTCARQNHIAQKRAYPDWDFGSISPNRRKQAIELAWEPLLESIPGCNGLAPNKVKHFKFLVVLDASWVHHYNQHKRHFATQGYHTLETSPNFLIDRVSYLYEQQFGVRISASRIVVLPGLKENCRKNHGYTDDDTMRTSTDRQLKRAGISRMPSDTGTMRLGVGSLDEDVYCNSHSPLGALCERYYILESHEKVFLSDGSGRINYESTKTLAHEVGHFFGVCNNKFPHCLHGHTQNEIPDLMVWNGEPAYKVRNDGLFNKFMTTCTPVYEDLLCRGTKVAKCAMEESRTQNPSPFEVSPYPSPSPFPSVDISGDYLVAEYGVHIGDEDKITVSVEKAPDVFRCTNEDEESWTLTRRADDPEIFDVGEECPWFEEGYTEARIYIKERKGKTFVRKIEGPSGTKFVRKSLVKKWSAVFCPHGSRDEICWAQSARKICKKNKRQAYKAVIAKRNAGMRVMYWAFTKFTKNRNLCKRG